MPLFWGNTATGTAYVPVATTTGSSAIYQAMLASSTNATTTSGSTIAWYSNALASQTATTTTTVPNAWYLIEGDGWVEHSQYVVLAQRRVVQTRVRTEEEERRDREMRERAQAEALRLAQQRAEALARSKELLLAHLTPAQRETFEANKWFVVEGGRSRQAYRIRDKGSYSANIDVLEGKPGKVTHRLCCHLADHRVPLYDHLLAQKVWIESDEEAFLRQANRHAA